MIIKYSKDSLKFLSKLDKKSVVNLLAQKNISALCMHTNLDLSTKLGVNTCLANAVGIKNPVLSVTGECLFYGQLES